MIARDILKFVFNRFRRSIKNNPEQDVENQTTTRNNSYLTRVYSKIQNILYPNPQPTTRSILENLETLDYKSVEKIRNEIGENQKEIIKKNYIIFH